MIQNQMFEQANLYSLANAKWVVNTALVHTVAVPQIATKITEDVMSITLQANNPFYLSFDLLATYTFNPANDILFPGGNMILQLYVPHGEGLELYLHTRAVTSSTIKLIYH